MEGGRGGLLGKKSVASPIHQGKYLPEEGKDRIKKKTRTASKLLSV